MGSLGIVLRGIVLILLAVVIWQQTGRISSLRATVRRLQAENNALKSPFGPSSSGEE